MLNQRMKVNSLNLSTYKFLPHESMIKKLYCSWCKKSWFNVLSKGKKYPLDKSIMQHIEIKHHKLATEIEIRPKVEKYQLQISYLFNLKEKIPQSRLFPLFRNVYFLAKENVSLIKSENLH